MKRITLYAVILIVFWGCNKSVSSFQTINEKIEITPDYTALTIPNNIAPLNFHIDEVGEKFQVQISSQNGVSILINSSTPSIQIPVKKWNRLLTENQGNDLFFDVLVKKEDGWKKYKTITNSISNDSINPYLAYRLINTQYTYSSSMKLAQRNLSNFDEDLIFENRSTKEGCFNCHSFSNYNPDKMSIHFRQSHGGTLIKDGETIKKLNTKTPFTMSAFGYVGWNPNGELIAYSVNKFNEYFTNHGSNLNEVTDQASDIVIYNVKTNTVTTSPKISTQNRENFPTWSPDGKFLYYLSADPAYDDFDSRFFSLYSLVRIEYNQKFNTWGEADTIYNAKQEGRSLTFPRISPDGKKIMFCLIDYGYFSINHRESDLYLMDLETREYEKLEISSDANDSYHSWSENGRWVVFSSKRYNNQYTVPYFVYYDRNGKFHKPFILPQKDPLFYDAFLDNYNIPEFINDKVELNPRKIRDILYEEADTVAFDKSVNVDALSSATWINSNSKMH